MELLNKLTQTPSPSGCEESICDIIKSEVEKFADDMYTDALGSLVVHIKGSGKRAMVCAHADTNHHAEASAEALLEGDEFARLEEVGASEVEHHGT